MIYYVLLLIRFFILFLVFTGYLFFLINKFKINSSFAPITTISLITLFMFGAGLLNILVLASKVLTAFGLLLFCFYFYKIYKQEFCINQIISPGIIFFVVLSGYFFILLKGVNYLHYDNFSHWGTIVKEMFYFNSFPDERTIITFRNYPPGTATFIYYVCKIIGYTESRTLMAQSLIISASLSAMFCNSKFKNYIYNFFIVVVSIISLSILSFDNSTLHIFNLLVDGVLSFLTVSSIIISYYYRNDIKKLFFINSCLLSMLILTKDSGKILFFMIAIFIPIFSFNKLKRKNHIFNLKVIYGYLLQILFIPLFFNKLWNAYVEKAYPSNPLSSNKFRISLASLTRTFKSRSSDFINELPHKLLKEFFNINCNNVKLFLIINIILILSIIFFICIGKKPSLLFKTFLLSNLMVILYFFNLYILYAMVMPEEEAVSLAGFDRYYCTITIVFTLVNLYSIINHASFTKLKYNHAINLCILFILSLNIFILKDNIQKLYNKPNEQTFRRYNIQKVCKEAQNYIARDESIILYNGKKASKGFCYYLATYEMLSLNCNIVTEDEITFKDNIMNILLNSNYLIIAEDKSYFWFILNNAGIYSDNQLANTYKIEKCGMKTIIKACI